MSLADLMQDASLEEVSEEQFLEDMLVATEAFEENEAALREARQYEVTLENLEHYAEVIGSIEEATHTELALIQAGTDAALEQHGIRAEHVFPSLESQEGSSISMEGIQNVIKAIWDAIVKVVTRVWDAINSFFKKIFNANKRLEKGNVNLKDRIEKYAGKSMQRKSTQLKSEINVFTVDGKALKNGGEVIKHVDDLINKATVVYGFYADSMIEAGEKIAKEIGKFDPDAPVKSLEAINTVIEKEVDFNAIQKLTGESRTVSDSRWPSESVHASSPMFKNKTLFYITPKPRGSKDSALGRAEALRNQRAVLQSTGTGRKGDPGKEEGTIATFSLSEMLTIEKRCTELTNMVAAYEENQKRIKAVGRKIDKACKALTSKLEKSENLSQATRAHYNAVVNLNVAFGRWSSKPTLELTKLVSTTVRACQTACHKSLANHEERKD